MATAQGDSSAGGSSAGRGIGRTCGRLFANALLFSLTASNGYAILASMKDRYVTREHLLDEESMSDYIALAQSTPGPVAVSGA